MIPGTSKILSKSGPGDLRIITKMLQKIQEKYGIILGTYYFVNMGHQIVRKFSKSVCPRYQMFSMFFDFVFWCFWICLCLLWVYVLKIFLRRWGIENDTFSITKQHPNLNMNFISVKKHEIEITLNFVFSRNVP